MEKKLLKGVVKTIRITDPTKSYCAIFNGNTIVYVKEKHPKHDRYLVTVAYSPNKPKLVDKDVVVSGSSLKKIVVEFPVQNDSDTIIHTVLPLRNIDWECALDDNLVDTGKEVEFWTVIYTHGHLLKLPRRIIEENPEIPYVELAQIYEDDPDRY